MTWVTLLLFYPLIVMTSTNTYGWHESRCFFSINRTKWNVFNFLTEEWSLPLCESRGNPYFRACALNCRPNGSFSLSQRDPHRRFDRRSGISTIKVSRTSISPHSTNKLKHRTRILLLRTLSLQRWFTFALSSWSLWSTRLLFSSRSLLRFCQETSKLRSSMVTDT